ncbi:MAG: 23S rRNA (uracil(1939)-C(5))-methyltransferase RlmD [Eggerthellaceae bacterium]|jgi:23S rRNA (uracil1939-C5)-methyltransferase
MSGRKNTSTRPHPGGSPNNSGSPAIRRETISIDALTYGPAGIGRTAEGKAVFVEGTAPGDTVTVDIVREKASFCEGSLVSVDEPGQTRIDSPFPAEALRSIAPWGHISYEAQLAAKRENLKSTLVRIAGLDADKVEKLVAETVASPHRTGYRNKLELGCRTGTDGHLEVGFHREKSHDLVYLDRIPLACKPLEKAPKALRGGMRYVAGQASDLKLFRIGMRASLRTKDIEVALWTEPGPFPRSLAVKVLRDALHPTSIVRVIADAGKSRRVKQVEVLWGKGCWEERLGDNRFKVSAPSFFQVNTEQAENLIALALERLAIGPGDFVADLYSGVGTFSIPLAKRGADVVAVESSGPAVRDLRRNADLNRVTIECIGGDSARELPELGGLDALVVDPPRAGLAESVPGDIALAAPSRVAYVSCDPATFARDIARFSDAGYELRGATPVDLFPQSFHAETVGILERRSSIR